MEDDKSLDSLEDSAPPASFIQIKDIFNNNYNKPKLEETKYSFANDNFINNSNEIIQNKINSFQVNEKKTQQNLSSYPNYQGNNTNKMMSLNKINTFNQEKCSSNKIIKNKNEYILNTKNGDYFDDIIIISQNKKIFHCINHNQNFKGKNGLISHCKDLHKFRCRKCGLFFGTKKKIDAHFKICEKDEIKENKNKNSECDFDDDMLISIHPGEIHDKNNQNDTERRNIFQKNNLEEYYKINNKNNKYENPMFGKYKNQEEEDENIKKI
jgi:hypothetical protein